MAMKVAKAHLETMGHHITSRWLNIADELFEKEQSCSDAQKRKFAKKDLTDIDNADLVIMDLSCDLMGLKGGVYVELGYCLNSKHVWLIGARPNIFCYLDGIGHYDSWEAVYKDAESLTRYRNVGLDTCA